MKADALAMLERLRTVYGLPNGVEEEALPKFFAEYVRALEGFDGKVLAKTGDHVLRNFKFWPRPAELVDVAEQFLPHANIDGTRAELRGTHNHLALAARDYMVRCPSSLIDMAMRQGWGRSLEDCARDVIRKFYDKNGKLPSHQAMTQYRMSHDDCDYYRQNGQGHLPTDAADIIAARSQNGATSRARDVTGEAAE